MNGVVLSKLAIGIQAVPKCSMDSGRKPLEVHSPGEPMLVFKSRFNGDDQAAKGCCFSDKRPPAIEL